MACRALACVPGAAAAVLVERSYRPNSLKWNIVHAEQLRGKGQVVQCQESVSIPSLSHTTFLDSFRETSLGDYVFKLCCDRQPKVSASATKEQVCKCLQNYSIEVTPAAARKVENFQNLGLQSGSIVNVTYLPNSKPSETVEVCRRLVEARLDPVAHVPARSFSNIREVDVYFKALREVGVTRIMVLGGGVSVPRGDLTETMDILDSGLVTRHGFTSVGVAAHPEGHPDIGDDVLMDALVRKAQWAREEGINMYFATQFCFEAEPIIKWEAKLRQRLLKDLGGDVASLPQIHLGVAGPAKISNLIKFATMSGIGQSMQFVTKHAGNAMKLMSTAAPDALIVGIASHQASNADCLISGVHFYPFGGLQKTITWASQTEKGHFSFVQDGLGFFLQAE